jgi:hypothetical protein
MGKPDGPGFPCATSTPNIIKPTKTPIFSNGASDAIVPMKKSPAEAGLFPEARGWVGMSPRTWDHKSADGIRFQKAA